MEQPENDPGAHDAAARRLTSVDLAAALDQFGDAALPAAGRSKLVGRRLDPVICAIGDIEGVPLGAIPHVVSLIRPCRLFVMARIDLGPPAVATLAQLRHSGVEALSRECPHALTDAAFLRWMKTTVEAARRVVKSMLLNEFASPPRLARGRNRRYPSERQGMGARS
jgi:hypothetical protein